MVINKKQIIFSKAPNKTINKLEGFIIYGLK